MKIDRSKKEDTHNPGAEYPPLTYEIIVQGHLDSLWGEWFEGMTLTYADNCEFGEDCTLICGHVADQAELHGLLIKIRDLNLTILSVRRVTPGNNKSDEIAIPSNRQ